MTAERDPDAMARLANRLAMLASESGEAENAGRAVGALARKLGLTGGDLKQIFLNGIAGAGTDGARSRDAARADGGGSDAKALQRSLDAAEARLRMLTQERNALRTQNAVLRAQLDRKGTSLQVLLVLGLTAAGAVLLAAVLLFISPSFRTAANGGPSAPASQAAPSAAAPGGAPGGVPAGRFAAVRAKGAPIRDIPDTGAPVLGTLPGGAHLAVRRLVWNGLVQWAEVEVDGRSVYVPTTEVDLP